MAKPPPRDVNSRNVAYQRGAVQRAHYDRLRTRADADRQLRQVRVFNEKVRREMLAEFPPEERERLLHLAEHGTPRQQREAYEQVLARVMKARERAAHD